MGAKDSVAKLDALCVVTEPRFGRCDPTGVADSTTAIQAAIDLAIANGGGTVMLPVGVFRITAKLDIDGDGVRLVGQGCRGHNSETAGSEGVVGTGVRQGATRIYADFTGGPAIRVWNAYCHLEGFTLDGSTTRKSTGASTDHGIHVESVDTAGGNTKRTSIRHVRVTNQPGNGIHMVNDLTSSRLDMAQVDHCEGHAIWIGGNSARTHKDRPGIVQINNCWTSRCGGHGLAVGVGDDDWERTIPYRIEIHNFETFFCCIRPAICADPANPAVIYLSGENILLAMSAAGGNRQYPSVFPTNIGVYVRGKHIEIRNHRAISNYPYCVYVDDFPPSSTAHVVISPLYVSRSLDFGLGKFDPAVYVHPDVRNVEVKCGGTLSQIETLMTKTAGTKYREHFGNTITTDVVETVVTTDPLAADRALIEMNRSNSSTVSLTDDSAGYIEFTNITRGILSLSGNIAGAEAAIFHFRVGDVHAHATVLAGTAGIVGTTGALAGTTGSDGNLTVSADSATNRLYIENRTGSTKGYDFTLTSTSGTSNPTISSEWTAV